jgi:hypothetical protein
LKSRYAIFHRGNNVVEVRRQLVAINEHIAHYKYKCMGRVGHP